LLYSNPEALDIMPVLAETATKEGKTTPNVPGGYWNFTDACKKMLPEPSTSSVLNKIARCC